MFVCGQVKLLGGVRETLWKCNDIWYVEAGMHLSILKCTRMLLLPQQPGLRHLQGWGKEPHAILVGRLEMLPLALEKI